jgi:hypothetical protein
LTIYDASGNAIRKVNINDNVIVGADGNRLASSRPVGSWDLKDAKGRLVADGTYLVRGVVKTLDGQSEKVSLILGVR